ncbi:VOC family protein [Kitasatospora sp. NBC_01287]|uniref:bleomycin resistance protein n=1 Tax=Kitasatospora sp. NBC_01287 TaxID=2903573 RepID=UPI002257C67F|nr:VOC family protein [Kitasatospora sp. NBC_01287]MCX4745789.1 VOC family protein [Kitasatospora sp. NBC_01287]
MDEYAVPILPSRDLDETLEFYRRLGFELRGRWSAEEGYLILVRGTVELHFRTDCELDPLVTASSCYLQVRDADALYHQWAQVGILTEPATGSRLEPPVDTDYRMREFALVDRSGNLLRIGSPNPTA